MSKIPYTSVTEVVARILSLFITLLCFSIYILSKEPSKLFIDWAGLIVHLSIFWIVYEIFSFCFFLLLQQFASTKDIQPIKSIEQPNDTLNSNNPNSTQLEDDFMDIKQ